MPNDSGQIYRDTQEDKGFVNKPYDPYAIPQLGDVIIGRAPGRANDQQITFHVNSSAGIQFNAVCELLLRLAREHEVGQQLPTDWFTQEHHP